MSETVFTKVDYDLNSLVKFISLGEIGLPDIQRPFVWKNAKVRDLFDSMYRGYLLVICFSDRMPAESLNHRRRN